MNQQETQIRDAIVEQIEARLAGSIDDLTLAQWAFDQFYDAELARAEQIEEDDDMDDSPIVRALDALMFGDEPDFRLGEAELRALVAQLKGL